MKDNELNITSDVFLYNEFVHKMEEDYGHLDSWLNTDESPNDFGKNH